MPKIDHNEFGILSADEKGQLKSVACNVEFTKPQAAAHSTAIKGTLFLHSMPHVHVSIKDGVVESLEASARKLDG